MLKAKFRAKAACRIAGIRYDRFNEAVAAGNYPCAPETAAGSARLFEESDIIGLFIYGQLLKQSFPPRVAGEHACGVVNKLKEFPASEQITRSTMANGASFYRSDTEGTGPLKVESAGGGVVHRVSFNMSTIRRYVERDMQEAMQTFGEEDE